MTNLLLNHPVIMFYLGVVTLALNTVWVGYIVVQGLRAHRTWKDGQQ